MFSSSSSARRSFAYKLILTCFQSILKDAWSLIFGGTIAEQNIIAIQLGKSVNYCSPWANTEMMNIFLRQVAEDFSDYFILWSLFSYRHMENHNVSLFPKTGQGISQAV
jgi:hypothetical protein